MQMPHSELGSFGRVIYLDFVRVLDLSLHGIRDRYA